MPNQIQLFKNIAHITSPELYDLEFTQTKVKLLKSKLKISHLESIQETQIYSIFFKQFYLRWDDDPKKSHFFSIVELIYTPEGAKRRRTINLAALNPSVSRENTQKLELLFDSNLTETLYNELSHYSISTEIGIPEPTFLAGALDDSLPARQKYREANR